MPAVVDSQLCGGCGNCVEVCPNEAIEIVDDKAVVNDDECLDCGACEGECPHEAITMA
jgi:NAD-dependent dihydropyrimidine dehydrogenase PreA subunit